MSDIKNLLEKMDAMSAAERKPTGPKWPSYWRGKDSAKKSRSRMVGDGGAAESVEESENFLKELNTVINSNPVKRDLFQEWQEYKSISEADKTVSPERKAQIRKDVESVSGEYGKEQQPQTTSISPKQKAEIKQAVSAYNQEKQDKKQTVDEETVRVFGNTPKNVPISKWDYDDPEIRFFHRYEDGSVEELSKGTPDYNDAWRSATRGREDPMTQKMIDLMQEPRQPSKEFKVPDPLSPQDYKVPGQDQGPYIPPDEQRSYMSDTPISEWGAAGLAIQEETAWEHEPTTVDVEMQRPTNVSKSKLDYNDPDVKFFHIHKDGRKEEVPKGSPNYNEYWRDVTGREDPMTQELIRGIKNPRQPGPEYKVPEPNNIQDLKIPGQDKGRYRAPLPNWKETEPIISEYGAPGSAIGNDTATNPAEVFAKGQERKASKEQTQGQIQGLVAQITGLRRQLADLNKQFPQGANPVEKTMSLQQMTAQRNGIKSQIVDLAKQIAQLRQQAM